MISASLQAFENSIFLFPNYNQKKKGFLNFCYSKNIMSTAEDLQQKRDKLQETATNLRDLNHKSNVNVSQTVNDACNNIHKLNNESNINIKNALIEAKKTENELKHTYASTNKMINKVNEISDKLAKGVDPEIMKQRVRERQERRLERKLNDNIKKQQKVIEYLKKQYCGYIVNNYGNISVDDDIIENNDINGDKYLKDIRDKLLNKYDVDIYGDINELKRIYDKKVKSIQNKKVIKLDEFDELNEQDQLNNLHKLDTKENDEYWENKRRLEEQEIERKEMERKRKEEERKKFAMVMNDGDNVGTNTRDIYPSLLGLKQKRIEVDKVKLDKIKKDKDRELKENNSNNNNNDNSEINGNIPDINEASNDIDSNSNIPNDNSDTANILDVSKQIPNDNDNSISDSFVVVKGNDASNNNNGNVKTSQIKKRSDANNDVIMTDKKAPNTNSTLYPSLKSMKKFQPTKLDFITKPKKKPITSNIPNNISSNIHNNLSNNNISNHNMNHKIVNNNENSDNDEDMLDMLDDEDEIPMAYLNSNNNNNNSNDNNQPTNTLPQSSGIHNSDDDMLDDMLDDEHEIPMEYLSNSNNNKNEPEMYDV